MNLPNVITLTRILIIPFFVMLLIYGMPGWALGLFIMTAITDVIDGYIARTRMQRTPLGTVLDPLADKLLLTIAFVTLAYLRVLPAWLAILVVSRDVIIVFGSLLLHLFTGRLRIEPTLMGKATTTVQVLAVSFGLLANLTGWGGWVLLACVWATAVLTVLSGVQYVYRGMTGVHQGERAQGG
ncbi:MAG: CDP-diacylglycerol--glycerol-3-phosphate 3-phosphatidyltransferase [bacterium]|nr:CDP-diacylglycerol--glycerol-3-phosphate 3-phosphatidyltransferase [bacterium]